MLQPRRVRVAELNASLVCALCSGYLIDATTIIECLHSFCRSCIVRYLQSNKYCPVCDVQVHKTKPLLNIRPDQILQDMVYKLVPGLFENEMRRRREWFSRCSPGELAVAVRAACDEQAPVCLSLEFEMDQNGGAADSRRRYLRCPPAVSVQHLHKLLRAKYGLSQRHRIEVLYAGEPLRPDLTLADITYIYLWRTRTLPLHFTYRIYEAASIGGDETTALLDARSTVESAAIGALVDKRRSSGAWKEVQLQISENGVMCVTNIGITESVTDRTVADEALPTVASETPPTVADETPSTVAGETQSDVADETPPTVASKVPVTVSDGTLPTIASQTPPTVTDESFTIAGVHKSEPKPEHRSSTTTDTGPSERSLPTTEVTMEGIGVLASPLLLEEPRVIAAEETTPVATTDSTSDAPSPTPAKRPKAEDSTMTTSSSPPSALKNVHQLSSSHPLKIHAQRRKEPATAVIPTSVAPTAIQNSRVGIVPRRATPSHPAYKTLRDPPRAWNPQLPPRPTGGAGAAAAAQHPHAPAKPPKFFKVRNNVPRYLGNPASGVKPMYPPPVTAGAGQAAAAEGARRPATPRPAAAPAPAALKINQSTVPILNPLRDRSKPLTEHRRAHAKNGAQQHQPPPLPSKKDKPQLSFTPPNPFVPNLGSPNLAAPNHFLFGPASVAPPYFPAHHLPPPPSPSAAATLYYQQRYATATVAARSPRPAPPPPDAAAPPPRDPKLAAA